MARTAKNLYASEINTNPTSTEVLWAIVSARARGAMILICRFPMRRQRFSAQVEFGDRRGHEKRNQEKEAAHEDEPAQ